MLAGSTTNMVQVLASRGKKTAKGGNTEAANGAEVDRSSRLGAWGYLPSECHAAMAHSGNDELATLPSLYQQLTGGWTVRR